MASVKSHCCAGPCLAQYQKLRVFSKRIDNFFDRICRAVQRCFSKLRYFYLDRFAYPKAALSKNDFKLLQEACKSYRQIELDTVKAQDLPTKYQPATDSLETSSIDTLHFPDKHLPKPYQELRLASHRLAICVWNESFDAFVDPHLKALSHLLGKNPSCENSPVDLKNSFDLAILQARNLLVGAFKIGSSSTRPIVELLKNDPPETKGYTKEQLIPWLIQDHTPESLVEQMCQTAGDTPSTVEQLRYKTIIHWLFNSEDQAAQTLIKTAQGKKDFFPPHLTEADQEDLLDETLMKVLACILKKKIDRILDIVQEDLAPKLSPIVKSWGLRSLLNYVDYFSLRSCQLLNQADYTDIFDDIIKELSDHIDAVCSAEKITQESFDQPFAAYQVLAKSKKAPGSREVQAVAKFSQLLSDLDAAKDPSVGRQKVDLAALSKHKSTHQVIKHLIATESHPARQDAIEHHKIGQMAVGFRKLLCPDEVSDPDSGEKRDSLDFFLSLMEAPPKEVKPLLEECEKLVNDVIPPDVKCFFTELGDTKDSVVSAVYKLIKQLVDEQLGNAMTQVVRLTTNEDFLKKAMADQLLPSINNALIIAILRQQFDYYAKEFAPLFQNLLEAQSDEEKDTIRRQITSLVYKKAAIPKNPEKWSADTIYVYRLLQSEAMAKGSENPETDNALVIQMVQSLEGRLRAYADKRGEPLNKPGVAGAIQAIMQFDDKQKPDQKCQDLYRTLIGRVLDDLIEFKNDHPLIGTGKLARNKVNETLADLCARGLEDMRKSPEWIVELLVKQMNEHIRDPKLLRVDLGIDKREDSSKPSERKTVQQRFDLEVGKTSRILHDFLKDLCDNAKLGIIPIGSIAQYLMDRQIFKEGPDSIEKLFRKAVEKLSRTPYTQKNLSMKMATCVYNVFERVVAA